LRMMIKDSPFQDAKALLITFSQVSVHRSDTPDGEWIKIAGERTCDLKHLESVQDLLGTESLGSGHYTQIRLLVSKAVVYFADESSGPACTPTAPATTTPHADLTIPSGEVKLNRPFDITEGATTTITVDFDGEKSVHLLPSGGYMMSPVISVVSVQ
jgi:Domain of unknown function (DUF4382)